jgi:hypothetical protein
LACQYLLQQITELSDLLNRHPACFDVDCITRAGDRWLHAPLVVAGPVEAA